MTVAVAVAGLGAAVGLGACGGEGSAATNPGGSGGDAGMSTGGMTGSGGGPSPGTGGRAGTGGGPGTPAGGNSGTGSCDAPPEASPLVGWAAVAGSQVATTTGGGAVAPRTVTTFAELNALAAGASPAVIWLSGTIEGMVKVGSNKTLVGLCGAQVHGHVDISGSSNVIVRNLTIVGFGVGSCALDPDYDPAVGCSSGNDAVSIQNNAHHVWFDHCDISDGTDGNLDITTGASFVTVSWTKFHYTPRTDSTGNDSTGASGHRFSNLVGGDDNILSDATALDVTWHHDWWADNVVERQPRVRFGKNHLFNNLWASPASSYCVRAGKQAEILIENSAFVGVKNPQQFNSAADQATAFITATNDLYTTTTGARATGGGGTAFTAPPYPYTMDPTAGLQAAIQAGAGPQ